MIRLAYPNDFRADEFSRLLLESGVARLSGGELLPAEGMPLDQLVGVSGNDLPILLLDGVFDVVLTSADRVAECSAGEVARRSPRQFGRMTPMSWAEPHEYETLNWGFAVDPGRQSGERVDWQDEIFDLARGGLGFAPNDAFSRTVLCATTHVELARATLRDVGVLSDVRYYPDPWSVVRRSPNYCGLGLVDRTVIQLPDLVVDTSNPMSGSEPVLVINEISVVSRRKAEPLRRIERSLRRYVQARKHVRLEFAARLDNVAPYLEDNPWIVYHRVYVSRGSTSSNESVNVEAVVLRSKAYQLADDLADRLGASRIVIRELHRLDLDVDL